jgi:RHS repeat-associated protein
LGYTCCGWAGSGAHAPFGESYSYIGYPEAFIGQDGDFTLGASTYYFPERQYRSSQGRWLSPDPAGSGAADPSNPQSWNRYAYVLNNPLRATDPDGLWCVWENDPKTGESAGHDDDPSNGGATKENCDALGGHWDPFDTITGVVTDGNGNVTQINYQGGTCTTADCGAGGTLEQFDQSLRSYSVLSKNPSWTGDFLASFFSRNIFATAWRSTVEEGGCDRLMFTTFAEDFNPLPSDQLDASDVKELAPKVAGKAILTGATAYSISKGLTVPLRSSVYRGIRAKALSNATKIEEAAPYVQFGYATADAIGTAGEAAYNGECH